MIICSRLSNVILATSALLLAACSADHSDLTRYIDSVKARTSTVVEPMPQVLVYEPFRYAQANIRDPFAPFAPATALSGNENPSNGLMPDFDRNREALEYFPLEGLRMRGVLTFRGKKFALVEAPDKVIHRVQLDNHMGQNFGRIVNIRDTEILLEEIVADGLGGYIKREATLALSGDEA